MAAVLRGAAAGLLGLAITLHVVGYVTHYWVTANLDTRGISGIMSANGMGDAQPGQLGMNINMGLWKYCMDLGPMAGADMSQCGDADADSTPGWMKGVQALGILSMIAAVLGVALLIYSFVGDSKGDRARLLPHITASICFLAGLLLLVGVVVYGAEFEQMMKDQMSMMGTNSPVFSSLVKNVKDHTHLGYSFALEALSGVLMILAAVLLIIPVVRGSDGCGPHNWAV